MVEVIVFAVCAAIVLSGAVLVIVSTNPVHSALALIQTLFGIAVLFISLEAHFLAAVQVVVYAGAIVILFCFVIMLLGVDQAEDLGIEPIVGQRFVAGIIGLATFALVVLGFVGSEGSITGQRSSTQAIEDEVVRPNVNQLAESLFTDYVFAFEATALLLTIAVVGAVVLARRPKGEMAAAPLTALEAREEQRMNAAAAAEADAEATDEAAEAGADDAEADVAEASDA